LFFADERAHLGFAIERRTEFDLLGFLCHRLDEVLVDRFLYENAASGGADFALIDEHAEESAVDGGLESASAKKCGRLAAEFKGDALHGVSSLFHDDLADGGASGEAICSRRDAGRASAAAFSEPVMMLTTPGGGRSREIICELKSGEWSLLGRLQNAGAAGAIRWSKLHAAISRDSSRNICPATPTGSLSESDIALSGTG